MYRFQVKTADGKVKMFKGFQSAQAYALKHNGDLSFI